MGRIGKRIVEIPKGVEAKMEDNRVLVKGPKGELSHEILPAVQVVMEGNAIKTVSTSEESKVKALHGLYNSLIKNMVEGVTKGFEKRLDIVGVGYRAEKQGANIVLQIGYSNPVTISPPAGIELAVEGATKIVVRGINKQQVGEIAANIRRIRKVEPYKGKGIRYEGEKVRRKAGKAAKAAAGGGAA